MIHDLGPLRYPERLHPRTVRMHTATARAAVRCDVVFTNAEYTANDVVERLGIPRERIRVAYPGVDARYRPDGERHETGRPYVFTTATEDWRKNRGVVEAALKLRGDDLTLLALGDAGRGYVTDEQLALAQQIFSTVGRTVVVDEKHMDAVTGLSGSGPAFLYIIIEALAEAGVNVGLPRDIATLLAAQTTFGSAKMVLETGSHPALLKDEVTTPAGCTVEGILELEEGGLRVTLIKAVKRATERARELASG